MRSPTRDAALALALLALPAYAGAQAGEAAPLLREGVALRQRGDDDAALERFREAHARCRCAEARAQMGLAAQALGRFADADAWLGEALDARGDRWIAANRAELSAARDVAHARTASLVVRGEAGAALQVDGDARGALDASGQLTLRLDRGRHRVALVAGDGRRAEDVVELLPGGESSLAVTLPPRAVAASAAPRTVTVPSAWRRAAPWLAVAGAAGVVGGGVALAFERRYTALWESPACLAGNRTREENCGPWRVSAERAEAAMVASWAAGGALLVAAAGMWWLAPRTATRLALRCAPTTGAGVACEGAF